MGKRGKASLGARVVVAVLAVFMGIVAAMIGVVLGFTLGETANVRSRGDFVVFAPALPSRVFDINGDLITEFAADERRELISIDELPRHLVHAIIAREDIDFFNHRGICVRGTSRAVLGLIQGVNRGGGSTITQQVARHLFLDPTEMSIQRKLREMWWALQLERHYSKNEILEIYLNYMIMGPGVFGVEAASRYFFGHSARYVTIAESAMLAVQLSSPTHNNPLRNPDFAIGRQRFVLDRMVEFGFATREEADASFDDFMVSFDFDREPVAAFFLREDRAPWFSEFVRRELDGMMFGTMDYFRDGFSVHTTLNLRHQEAAERFMAEGLARANAPGFRFVNESWFASDWIDDEAYENVRAMIERNDPVEGALITIENHTGHITAIVGGSEFSQANQFIRATQANVQTGSAFKPLYFSAALDARQVTASTLIHDGPIVFHNEDGTLYTPVNFGGTWRGPILMHRALNVSLNIPALLVLESVGFDAAIERSAALLGITDQRQIEVMFPRVYPLALGVTSTSPMHMARAFAIFASEGREITPIAIRRVEDRNGRVILNPEQDIAERKRRQGNPQVISSQNAYVMSRIMQRTGEGTMHLAANTFRTGGFRDAEGEFVMPVAGKTGTSQSWGDAWVVGYSPYYTTAIWFGFDVGGNSLGQAGTGAGLVGPVWGRYMREIHQGLPRRDFVRPATGVVYVTVCTASGLLVSSYCTSGIVTLPFIAGTQPTRACDTHGTQSWASTTAMNNIRTGTLTLGEGFAMGSFTMPSLPDDLFGDLFMDDLLLDVSTSPTLTGGGAQVLQPAALEPSTWTPGNPLLDGQNFTMPMLNLDMDIFDVMDAAEEDSQDALWIVGDGADTWQEPEIPELAIPEGNPLLD